MSRAGLSATTTITSAPRRRTGPGPARPRRLGDPYPASNERDVHPGVGQRPDRIRFLGLIGDEPAHRRDLADPGEGDLPDLGTVGHHDHPPGMGDHGAVRVRLYLLV